MTATPLTAQSPNRSALGRLWLPVALVLGLVAMATNESVYQHSLGSLKRGIDLTDARLLAAGTLQSLTDAELSARQYLANGRAADLKDFEATMAAMPSSLERMLQFLARHDLQSAVSPT